MKKNVVLITADNMRSDSLSMNGSICFTPHLDGLALGGAYLTNVRSRHSTRTEVKQSILGLDTDETLASFMKKEGYQTELIGHDFIVPEKYRAGFEYVTRMSMRDRMLKKHMLYTSGVGEDTYDPCLEFAPAGEDTLGWITDRAMDFIDNRDQTVPFFLWISYPCPHPPLQVPEPFYTMYRDYDVEGPIDLKGEGMTKNEYVSWKRKKCTSWGLISHMDEELGRFFGKLMKENVWEDSAIIFTSSIGDSFGDRGEWGSDSTHDEARHVPVIVRPCLKDEDAPGATDDTLLYTEDMGRIIRSWTESGNDDIYEEIRKEGKDHLILNGKKGEKALVKDGWKLIRKEDGTIKLFNLMEDNREIHEADNEEKKAELLKLMEEEA